MKIRCLIIDDEPLAIRLIEKYISRIESLEVVATCNTALKSFEILNTKEIDLMFLDIKMPTISGVSFLKSLKNPPRTIFTTAHRDYAIESYDLDTVDYLLKPITFERFLKSINKFLREFNTTSFVKKNNEIKDFILMKSGNKYHKIKISSIVYIESLKDYIKIHTTENAPIISKYKISDIEKKLIGEPFLRVHRSYIINIDRITAFTMTTVEVSNIKIPIGGIYKDEVIIFLNTKMN